MKTLILNCCLLVIMLNAAPALAQNEASKELDPLVGMALKEAHTQLLADGYEIAQSSIFNTKQMWYQEGKNECVIFNFSKDEGNTILSIQPAKEKKCINGVRASRRVWETYINGGAEASSSAIDQQRNSLSQNGYVVSYWIKDVSPGKTMEVWYNESQQLCKSLVWDTGSKGNVKVVDRDPRLGKNPAPIYKVN